MRESRATSFRAKLTVKNGSSSGQMRTWKWIGAVLFVSFILFLNMLSTLRSNFSGVLSIQAVRKEYRAVSSATPTILKKPSLRSSMSQAVHPPLEDLKVIATPTLSNASTRVYPKLGILKSQPEVTSTRGLGFISATNETGAPISGGVPTPSVQSQQQMPQVPSATSSSLSKPQIPTQPANIDNDRTNSSLVVVAPSVATPKPLLAKTTQTAAVDPPNAFSSSNQYGAMFPQNTSPGCGTNQSLQKPPTTVAERASIVLYFIKMNGNTKHPLSYFTSVMAETCKFMKSTGWKMKAAGDVDLVRKSRGCESLADAGKSSIEQVLQEHPDYAAAVKSVDPRCHVKFNGNSLLVSSGLAVWLHKFDAICKAAEQDPEGLTIMIDAGLHRRWFGMVLKMGKRRLNGHDDVMMAGRRYQHFWGRPTWYGMKARCTETPLFSAAFMAVRGRDCPLIRSLWCSEVRNATAEAKRAKESGVGCPCFDEEMLMTRIVRRNPHLFAIPWWELLDLPPPTALVNASRRK